MWIAFIPVMLWALNSIFSARAARLLGPAAANRGRLMIAVAALGAWVLAGPGVPRHGGSWRWLLLSGAVGLGLGDLAMFAGYRRIGARITILLLLCLAVPVAGVSEWLWIGTRLGLRDALLSGVILAGVALAVAPGARLPARDRRTVAAGIAWGVLAALGQGLGTTLSRVAYASAAADGAAVNGVVAAWQRMLGGLACTLVVGPLLHAWAAEPPPELAAATLGPAARPGRGTAAGLLLASAFLGPVLGLSAYQWALISIPGAVAQAITSLTPVAVIPLAWWMDGDRPDWRGLAGGLLACLAAAGLAVGR